MARYLWAVHVRRISPDWTGRMGWTALPVRAVLQVPQGLPARAGHQALPSMGKMGKTAFRGNEELPGPREATPLLDMTAKMVKTAGLVRKGFRAARDRLDLLVSCSWNRMGKTLSPSPIGLQR